MHAGSILAQGSNFSFRYFACSNNKCTLAFHVNEQRIRRAFPAIRHTLPFKCNSHPAYVNKCIYISAYVY